MGGKSSKESSAAQSMWVEGESQDEEKEGVEGVDGVRGEGGGGVAGRAMGEGGAGANIVGGVTSGAGAGGVSSATTGAGRGVGATSGSSTSFSLAGTNTVSSASSSSSVAQRLRPPKAGRLTGSGGRAMRVRTMGGSAAGAVVGVESTTGGGRGAAFEGEVEGLTDEEEEVGLVRSLASMASI